MSLIGAGNVEVTKAGGTYRIHFKGALGGTAIALARHRPDAAQERRRRRRPAERSSTPPRTADASALLTSTSLTGLDLPAANEIQQLVVDATSGQYTLTYAFPVMPSNLNAVQSTGGGLTAGTHFYKVTAFTASGESLASNLASAVTADSGAVDLDLDRRRRRASATAIYRGSTEAMDAVLFVDTHGTALSFHDVGGGAAGTLPTVERRARSPDDAATSSWNADASVVQAALEALPGIGAGNVVVIAERRRLHDPLPGHAQRRADPAARRARALPSLQKRVEQLGGGVAIVTRHCDASTRAPTSATRRRRSTRFRS